MMVLFVAGAALAAVAGAGLAIARSRLSLETGDLPSRGEDTLVHGLVLLVATGLTLVVGGAIFAAQSRFPNPPLIVFGAVVGVIFFSTHCILRSLDLLFRWGTRRRLQLNAPAYVLWNTALTLLGYVAVGLIIVEASAMAPRWFPLVAALPFLVALFPLYEHSVKPRLLFPRSFEIGAENGPLPDIVAWIRETAERLRLGQVRVALIPGDTINAFATGMGWSGRWILLGEGLVRHMTRAEVRWVAAHELAHVIRRDVPKLVVAAVVAGSLHAIILVSTVFPLYDGGRYFAASMLGGISGGLVVGVLPGVLSRRIELATDALGVRLAGDPDAACSALERLAEVTQRSPTQGSLTHPPVRRRVEAIRGQAE